VGPGKAVLNGKQSQTDISVFLLLMMAIVRPLF
jgi:hypothetical protein